jgi:hypothetical protein
MSDTNIYGAKDTVRLPGGNECEFLVSATGEVAGPLSNHAGMVLKCCSEFRTRDHHAIDLTFRFGIPAEHFDGLRDMISQLVNLGLLVSGTDLLKEIAVSCRHDPAPISTIGFVTCNRTLALSRSVESAIDNAIRSGRNPEVVVMDDSDESNGELNREAMQAQADAAAVDLLYAGRKEKEEFARLLTLRWLVPPEVVRFALFDPEGCNHTVGANRNALLLDTIGSLILSLDDDVMCQTVNCPSPGTGVRFSSRYWQDFWFYPDRESALREAQFVEKDILGAHEAFLGRGIGDVICDQQAEFDGADIGSQLLRSRVSGNGRILATMPGIVGDSGMGYSWPFLMARGETHRRLTASESCYRSALASKEVLKVSDRPTFDVSGLFMTTIIGLDNRDLLPPFMPVYRNEDGIFGAILAKYFDEEYSVHLPWAALHDAATGRGYWPTSASFPPHICDVLPTCINAHAKPASRSRARRLESLGHYLSELGSLPFPEFEQQMRFFVCQQLSRLIVKFENALQEHADAPGYWTSDVRQTIELFQNAISNPNPTQAAGSDGNKKRDEFQRLSQRLLRQYGELLCAWPSLVACARDLCRSGHRIAQPVNRPATVSMSQGVGKEHWAASA